MHTISILNNKGGSGKTTLTYLIAMHLASKYDKKICIIDFDSQASMSTIFNRFEHTVNDALKGRWSLVECLSKVADSVFLIPCDRELAQIELEMMELKDREFVLKKLVEELKSFTDFDYIFIDANPTLNILQLNILNAIDTAIITVNPSFLDIAGLTLLDDVINTVKTTTNNNLNCAGVIINQFNSRLLHDKDTFEYVTNNYNLIGTVSQSVAIKDAYFKKQSLVEIDKRHKVNDQIDLIIKELRLI